MSLKIEEDFDLLGKEFTRSVVTEAVPYYRVPECLRMCHWVKLGKYFYTKFDIKGHYFIRHHASRFTQAVPHSTRHCSSLPLAGVHAF